MPNALQKKEGKTMKKQEVQSIQMDLKFQHFASFNDMRLVYQFINAHSGRGRKPNSASTFIAEAFNSWDSSLTPDMVDAYVEGKTIEEMLESRNVRSLDELYFALSQCQKEELEDLPPCGRRGVKVYLSREPEKRMYDVLKNHTEKNRAFIVYLCTKNYIARHDPPEYYKVAGDRLWQQLVNLYYTKGADSKFQKIIKTVIEPHILKYAEKDSEEKTRKKEKEDALQKELKDLFGK